MKYLLILSLLMFPTLAITQDVEPDPLSECAAVLASPPFVDILTRNEGTDSHEFSSVKSGRALLGLECSVDEFTEFFEDAKWEFLGFDGHSLAGPLGVPGAEYYSDASAHYCLKRPTLFGVFDFRCRVYAVISFHEGRISNLIVHVSK